jgi:ABC-type transport system involved in multi-copper enzyme maturation permease subunit
MVFHVINNELRVNFLSLRFHLLFLITIIVFGIGTLAFLKSYDRRLQEYQKNMIDVKQDVQKTAERNATGFALKIQEFILGPRVNVFISDAKDDYMPNSYTYNAYAVFGFKEREGSANPLLKPFLELNWGFIVSFLISFTVFIVTYDSISGEKETRTLAITLSNPLSRGTLLWGKYLAAILTSLFMLVTGVCLSMILILVSKVIPFSSITFFEIVGFLFASGVFIACIAACGLLSSILVKQSNVSMLIALVMWLLFAVIVPNTAVFWPHALFPIENSRTVQGKVYSARADINKNSPPASFISNPEFPFTPQHELNAHREMNILNSMMQIRNSQYNHMFRQYTLARLCTFISPVSMYNYLCEAVVGGGYLRFQKVWADLHIYQQQLFQFFKDFDAKDPDSPHWFNPGRDLSTSRKPLNFAEVPVFTERIISPGERFLFAAPYLAVIVLYTAVIFFITFVMFTRYDVR